MILDSNNYTEQNHTIKAHRKIAKAMAKDEILKPEAIKKFLDEYVIGQEYAKKILSVAVYNHMKRLKHYYEGRNNSVEIEKSNIIMVGPSGCGKTHLIKNLAKLFDVPYAIADATTLTESGYVGNDVETVLQKLIYAADGDLEAVERGIIFIDEIDKKANKEQENMSITRDVSGEGVQQALLKLIEGNIVDVQISGARKHPYAETVPIDTSKILFIVGGAFSGIEKIIYNRLQNKNANTIGMLYFNRSRPEVDKISNYNDVIDCIQSEDLRTYGLIPEFIGRLPIICPLHALDEVELCKILTEPKNALVKQYQALLGYDNIKLCFTKEALQAIANKAISNKTGARGLRSIMETLLLDLMYQGPGLKSFKNKRVLITEEIVKQGLSDNTIKFEE